LTRSYRLIYKPPSQEMGRESGNSNVRLVSVFEADVNDVLEKLGLDEFVEDWTLNLEKDIG